MSLVPPNNGTNPTFFADFTNDNHWDHYDKLGPKSKLPAVNIEQLDDHYQVSLVSPGMSKRDFTISLEKNVLTIEGNSNRETVYDDETRKFLRREFSYKSFKRSFQLPENIDESSVKAVYEEGILKVSIPYDNKKPEDRTIKITVE